MKIIFSRKGFDTGSGGAPSPIINGVPVSLPIPGNATEPNRYQDIEHPRAGNLGEIVEDVSNERILRTHHAHYDPILPWEWGPAALGQVSDAQAHLDNQGVDVGDVFVFFGLFKAKQQNGQQRLPDHSAHHRIFGMLRVEERARLGLNPAAPQDHPWGHHCHFHRNPGARTRNPENNTLWTGEGQMAHSAIPELRLSLDPPDNKSIWSIPAWLTHHRMSYHPRLDQWEGNTVRTVARGQEFVSDVGNDADAAQWVQNLRELLNRAPG